MIKCAVNPPSSEKLGSDQISNSCAAHWHQGMELWLGRVDEVSEWKNQVVDDEKEEEGEEGSERNDCW